MTTSEKPGWVKALDEAQAALRAAVGREPVEKDSQVRVAYAWMDVAKLLKED